jgi:nitrate reductase delta subunit
MRTFKVLGFLLSYPSQTHLDVLDECQAFLKKECWLSDKALLGIENLLQYIKATDLLDLQEEYVSLFDRTPSLSLHLFEHIHGDSRERGQAMVDLCNVYEEAGLLINTEETPDFLPLFLEYVSTLSPEDVKDNLGSVVNILSVLGERLKGRDTHYASIFTALVDAASQSVDPKAVEEALRKASGEAYDLEQLDKEWEEQFAFENTEQTTGQNGGCPKAEEMLARVKGYQKEWESV